MAKENKITNKSSIDDFDSKCNGKCGSGNCSGKCREFHGIQGIPNSRHLHHTSSPILSIDTSYYIPKNASSRLNSPIAYENDGTFEPIPIYAQHLESQVEFDTMAASANRDQVSGLNLPIKFSRTEQFRVLLNINYLFPPSTREIDAVRKDEGEKEGFEISVPYSFPFCLNRKVKIFERNYWTVSLYPENWVGMKNLLRGLGFPDSSWVEVFSGENEGGETKTLWYDKASSNTSKKFFEGVLQHAHEIVGPGFDIFFTWHTEIIVTICCDNLCSYPYKIWHMRHYRYGLNGMEIVPSHGMGYREETNTSPTPDEKPIPFPLPLEDKDEPPPPMPRDPNALDGNLPLTLPGQDIVPEEKLQGSMPSAQLPLTSNYGEKILATSVD